MSEDVVTSDDVVTPTSRWSRRPLAWQHQGFRRLTAAWVFTNLADSALYLMVAVWVKELTGSDSAAGLVFAMLGLPSLLAPFLGQLADRMSRKRLLVLTNTGVGAVVSALFLVEGPDQVWLIYLVVLAYATVGYLTGAAQSGLLRDLLPDEHLASGNGLLSSIDQSLRLVSPLLGTALYAAFGPRAVVALTIGAFLVAAALLAGVRVTESPLEDAASRGRYWVELTAGFTHLVTTPVLGRLTLVIAIAFGATGLVNVAVFPVIEQGLGLAAASLGPLVSVQGVGAVLAGLTAGTLIGRWGEVRVFAAGMLALGLGMLPLAFSSVVAVVVGLALVGAGATWSVVAFVTVRQRLTPPRLQGRTSAAANVSINLPQTLFTLGGAAVLTIVDYRLLVAATALVVLAAVALTPRRSHA